MAALTLENYDGRYDALNTSSPLYPNITQGKEVRVKVVDSGGVTHGVIRGKIDTIMPDSQQGLVTINLEDGWRWLYSEDVYYDIQDDIRIDEAIGHCLDQVEWPAAWGRSLGTAADEMQKWWGAGGSGAKEIQDLAESELGEFWVDRDGQACFIGRHGKPGVASSGTFTSAQLLKEVGLPQPNESVRNVARVRITLPVVQSTQVLWTLQSKPYIGPGESLTFFAEFSYGEEGNIPAENLITPVANTDYTANTQQDGGGSDLTASFSAVMTKLGIKSKIVMTNNGGTGGFLTMLKQRGDPVTMLDITTAEAINTASKNIYGPRLLDVTLPWAQDVLVANDKAYYLQYLLGSPLAFPVVYHEGRPDVQFDYDLFQVVTLDISEKGLSGDYFIAGLGLDWLKETGQGVKTSYWLEQKDAGIYWIFPTRIGQTSYFGY